MSEKLFLGGVEIVCDDNFPSDTAYLIGPKAIENLMLSPSLDGKTTAYEEWISAGMLKFVSIKS